MKESYKKKNFEKNLWLEANKADEKGGKLPPQAVDIEEVVLGAILVESSGFLQAKRYLSSFDFYKEGHGKIFQAFERLYIKSEAIDIMTVTQELRRTGELEFIGGASYLVKLSNKVNSSANIEFHCAILVELSRRRAIISISHLTIQNAYEDTKLFSEILEEMQSTVYKLAITNLGNERTFVKVLNDSYNQMMASKHKEVIGIPSRYNSENETTGGYKRKTLRVIGARPAMGKSLHMINEATAMAYLGYSVMIFSLEMPAEEQTYRMLSHIAQIEYKKIETGKINSTEDNEIIDAIGRLADLRIVIDDSTNIDVLYLSAKIRRQKMLNEQINNTISGVDIVFIDYLQLMAIDGDSDDRNKGLGKITRTLHNLAKELDICIVLYSQLSRAVETRGGDKRPQLSDLRESGEIEQDADVVQFLYRPEYYKITKDEDNNDTRGLLEIITAKNRQGGLGISYLKFMPTVSTIKNEDPRRVDF
jgi:replicative DNA helicase